MNLRLHPVPAIVEAPLHALVEQRRIAWIASGAALAAAVYAGLRLPVAWSAEPCEASEMHFEELARAVPAETEVIYGIGGGLAADAAKYVAWRCSLPLVLIPTALSVDAHISTAHDPYLRAARWYNAGQSSGCEVKYEDRCHRRRQHLHP